MEKLLMEYNDAVLRFIDESGDIETVAELYPHVKTFMEMLLAGEYLAFEAIYSSIDVREVSTVALVSLLRSAWMYRDNIATYQMFLDSVACEIIDNRPDRDVERILVGLPFDATLMKRRTGGYSG